jgi:hypothetical protein
MSSDYTLLEPHTNLFDHTPLSLASNLLVCLPATNCPQPSFLCLTTKRLPTSLSQLSSSPLLFLTPGNFPVMNLFTKSSPEGKVKSKVKVWSSLRCLVASSNGRCPLSCGSPNYSHASATSFFQLRASLQTLSALL